MYHRVARAAARGDNRGTSGAAAGLLCCGRADLRLQKPNSQLKVSDATGEPLLARILLRRMGLPSHQSFKTAMPMEAPARMCTLGTQGQAMRRPFVRSQ